MTLWWWCCGACNSSWSEAAAFTGNLGRTHAAAAARASRDATRCSFRMAEMMLRPEAFFESSDFTVAALK